jgi:hypothetical protein
MIKHFCLTFLLLVCSSAMGETELKSRLESQPVGKEWRDEATGIVRVFLQKNAGASEASGWWMAESRACGFKVELPGPSNELKQEAKATDGVLITVVTMGSRTREGAKYSATCYRRSDDIFKSGAISHIYDELAASGVVIERREVTRSGHRMQSMKLRRTDSDSEFETFQLGSTLYQLIVEYPKSEADDVPAMAEHFFDSFRP